MDVDKQYTADAWYEMMKLCFERGINFFDNAEAYGESLAEKNMGFAIKKGITDGVWSREDLVITTKIFFGVNGFHGKSGPNDQGLSRKHFVEGIKASLKRLDVDYLDVIYYHQPDPYTPIEESVRAMNYVIKQGWALYWGTSSWSASQIVDACTIADRLGLIRPVVEQPDSILERNKVEFEYVDLYKKYKLGLTTWSPLCYGFLTGKYSSGVEDNTRLAIPEFKAWVPDAEERVVKADKLQPIAAELGISMAELALAWCVSNENVSTVMIGARNISQLERNLKVVEVLDKITLEVKTKIDEAIPFVPRAPHEEATYEMRQRFL